MIELSCDLGEASDDEGRAVERVMWELVDAVNVACGGHAGDEESMLEAVLSARRTGIILGAHPSYPDRENFGRKSMAIDLAELRRSLIAQIGALRDAAGPQGVALERVKAHGALYNEAYRDRELAEVLIDAMLTVDPTLAVVAPTDSEMATAARANEMDVISEAFADRRYMPDGTLVSRRDPDALLSVEEAAEQAWLLATESAVIARGGTRLSIAFDTICLHADMEGSLERIRAIRRRLGVD